MTTTCHSPEIVQRWGKEALALAAQAKVLSGNKLEQLVVRLQRHTGRSREQCWRFVIQYGLKGKVDHRRWTEEEVEFVREELVRRSVDEIAKKLDRTPKSIRSMLQRNGLCVRQIRCDVFSIESLAKALHVRKSEIHSWIDQGWLLATVTIKGNRPTYTITPESLKQAYSNHLPDLLKRGLPSQSLFEAFVQYAYSPKHTVGEQLLDVRRDKKERAAFASSQTGDAPLVEEEEEDVVEERYRFSFG